MPQLDISTYMNQSLWLVLIYIIYYYIFKAYIIPYNYENYRLIGELEKISLNTTNTNTINTTNTVNTTDSINK